MAKYRKCLRTGLIAGATTAYLLLFGALPAHAGTWFKAESAHFIVYSDAKEGIVQDYIAQMEAYDFAADQLFSDIGDSKLDSSGKLTFIYLAKSTDFQLVKPGMKKNAFYPILSCRKYEPQLFAVSDDDGAELVDQRFNTRDLSYMFRSQTVNKIREYFSYNLPHWAYVGLQDYFMMTHVDGNKVLVGLPSLELMNDNGGVPERDPSSLLKPSPVANILPLRTIVESKAENTSSSRLGRFEQWVLINYFLTDSSRKTKFLEYLARLSNGADNWTAFTEATGMTDEQFKAIYTEYTHKGPPYLTYTMNVEFAGQTRVTHLKGANNNAPLIAAALQTCPASEYGQTLASQARVLLNTAPDDEAVLRANIIGEIDFGDPAKAAPLVDKLLQIESGSEIPLYLQGRMHLSLADKEAGDARAHDMVLAREAFGRAYQINPSSVSANFSAR